MADPNPVVSLPNAEFIEIINVGNQTIDLKTWRIADAQSNREIEESFLIEPLEIVLLIDKNDIDLFLPYGKLIGVSSLPSLNNSGDKIRLFNPQGEVVDEIEYDKSWYANELKEDGGWSIERINPNNDCDLAKNWMASDDVQGGTPGKPNSILNWDFVDDSPPELLSLFYSTSQSIQFEFSKRMDEESLLHIDNYTTEPSLAISQLEMLTPTTLEIKFEEDMVPGKPYHLMANNLSDCSQNHILKIKEYFGFPIPIATDKLVINEILFNPFSGGVDFIELFYFGEELVDLNGLRIVEYNVDTGQIAEELHIQDQKRYLLPNTRVVVTSSADVIEQEYRVEFPNQIFELTIPNFPDKEGIVSVLSPGLLEIDRLHYYEDWHFEGLQNVEGVSLERINPYEETQQKSNWFSASYFSGNATPTGINSQYYDEANNLGNIEFSSTYITPNLDGDKDFLFIQVPNETIGWKSTISIYSLNGALVTYLVNNQILGQINEIRWDGTDETGALVPAGSYIVLIELLGPNGEGNKTKKRIVVSR